VQTGAEMAANAVPVVGGPIAVLLAVALDYRLNQRRERWFTELAEAVEELQERFDGFHPDALADNDAFVYAVMAPTRIVDHTSQIENSVCCATLSSTPRCRRRLTRTSSVFISP
jgi:hypothetical protein